MHGFQYVRMHQLISTVVRIDLLRNLKMYVQMMFFSNFKNCIYTAVPAR